MIKKNVPNFAAASWRTTDGCYALPNPALILGPAAIANKKQNDIVSCLGRKASSPFLVLNVTTKNITHPGDKNSYIDGYTNKPPTYTNWITGPLNNIEGHSCAAVRDVDGRWTNRDCTNIDVACKYSVMLSPVVALMQDAVLGTSGDPNVLIGIEQQLRTVAINDPDLVNPGEILTLGSVQLSIKTSTIKRNRKKEVFESSPNLTSAFVNYRFSLHNIKQRHETLNTPVMSFPRNVTDSIRSDASSGDGERLVSPGTVSFITVSGYYGKNGTLPGFVDIRTKRPESTGVCEDLILATTRTEGKSSLKFRPVCAFINQTTKLYSTSGCVTSYDTETNDVNCTCNHLTMFAVLLAVRNVVIPTGVSMVSYATESSSIAFLGITLAILLWFKDSIKGDRTPVQINLAVALLIFHAVNLSHDLAIRHDEFCVAHCAINHYFLLATGCWVCVEGVRIFMATSDPVGFKVHNEQKRYRVFLVVGWAIPLVIVGASLAVGIPLGLHMEPQPFFTQCQQYRNETVLIPKYDRCWLAPGTRIFYSTVVAPLAVILLINLIIVVKISVVMLNSKRMQNRNQGHSMKDISRAGKSLFFLFVMLGGTWAIAFFTGIGNEVTSQVFLYINALVNGAQGVIVFLLYCAMNDIIREKLLLLLNIKKKKKNTSKGKSTESKPIKSVPRPKKTSAAKAKAKVQANVKAANRKTCLIRENPSTGIIPLTTDEQ
uniref:Adhesion G-protein coupled receptor D1-like n=1 Tax=Phallusia mammillata TaxID=59560 RepID=A0A6F9D642_9ASCI|nr:adhesion G-protein coupled receptor D1-like [Phallusia mammillata]